MQRISQDRVKMRVRESEAYIIADVVASQMVKRQNVTLRMELQFALDIAERVADARPTPQADTLPGS